MTGNDIRQRFLDFFPRPRPPHRAQPSLVPANDPTLLFTNAGMNQFKEVFQGLEKRDYTRATTSQKCVRAGGKHNDLENVGYTRRHHTFFEMLGNFSFGDYFKADAIEFAWDLVTREYGLPKDRLYITVFREDDDAEELWQKRRRRAQRPHLPPRREGQFLADGRHRPLRSLFGNPLRSRPRSRRTGPRTRAVSRSMAADASSKSGTSSSCSSTAMPAASMTPLPRPSIDTGMGLERVAAILQGKLSNYDTDLILPDHRSRRRTLFGMEYGGDPADRHRAPHQRRPRPRHRLSDSRWRAALERRPRLRAAQNHAPRHAQCAA